MIEYPDGAVPLQIPAQDELQVVAKSDVTNSFQLLFIIIFFFYGSNHKKRNDEKKIHVRL